MIYIAILILIMIAPTIFVLSYKLYLKQRIKKKEALKEKVKHYLFLKYVKQHKEQIETWAKAHTNELPPIYWDESRSEWVWLTRDQRRELKHKGVL